MLEQLAAKTALATNLSGNTENDLKAQIKTLWSSIIDWILEHPQEFRFLSQFGESAIISNNSHKRVEVAFADYQSLFT
jgi:hypothetical protein